jgi:hypothetical protein
MLKLNRIATSLTGLFVLGSMAACGGGASSHGTGGTSGASGAGGTSGASGAGGSCSSPSSYCFGECAHDPLSQATCSSQGTWTCPGGLQMSYWCPGTGGTIGSGGAGGGGGTVGNGGEAGGSVGRDGGSGGETGGGGAGGAGGTGDNGGAGGAGDSCSSPTPYCFGECAHDPILQATCGSQGTWACPSGFQTEYWCPGTGGSGGSGGVGGGGGGGTAGHGGAAGGSAGD